MNNNVKLFLKNYEEMVKAANAIDEFNFEFFVRIITHDPPAFFAVQSLPHVPFA